MKNLLPTIIAVVLFAGCNVDSLYNGYLGPAEQAMFDDVRTGNIEDVKKFLDGGGNVNMQDEPGCTPLHWAVNEDFSGSHIDMIELLIAEGADVNAEDDLQTTPLQMASNKEAAQILINAGASVNAKDHEGKTLLFSAMRNAANASDTYEMYKSLVCYLVLEANVDLQIRDNAENSPLHLIAGSLQEAKAIELMNTLWQTESGMRANDLNLDGQTPLDIAIVNKRTDFATSLRQHGGKTSDELEADGE